MIYGHVCRPQTQQHHQWAVARGSIREEKTKKVYKMWLDNIIDLTQMPVTNLLDSTQDETQWIKVVAYACVRAPPETVLVLWFMMMNDNDDDDVIL